MEVLAHLLFFCGAADWWGEEGEKEGGRDGLFFEGV